MFWVRKTRCTKIWLWFGHLFCLQCLALIANSRWFFSFLDVLVRNFTRNQLFDTLWYFRFVSIIKSAQPEANTIKLFHTLSLTTSHFFCCKFCGSILPQESRSELIKISLIKVNNSGMKAVLHSFSFMRESI